MKLEQSFEVEAPMDEVWAALVDVERVAPCLPGAAVTGRNDDGSYDGTFTIKIGPTTASYTGKLELQEVDESAHTATMHAQGSDKRGQGGATATISSRLTSGEGGTRVEVVTDYHITGRLARFGRGGMIEDISERLLREFAGRLQSSLAGSGQPAASAAAAASVPEPPAPGREESASEQPTVEAPRARDADEGSAASVIETVRPPAEPAPRAGDPAPPPSEAAVAPAETTPPVEAAAPVEPSPPPPEPAAAPSPPEPPAAEATEPATSPPRPGPPSPPPQGAPPPPPQAAPAPPLRDAPPPPPPGPPPPPPTAEPAPPVQGLSLVGGVMLDRIKRNPKPLIAVAGGLLLLRVVIRRR